MTCLEAETHHQSHDSLQDGFIMATARAQERAAVDGAS